MNNRNVLRHLKRAKKYIDKGWCKGVLARDEYDFPVHPTDIDAVSWCAVGALDASEDASLSTEDVKLVLHKCMKMPTITLGMFNDACKSKKDVLKLFDKAINKLQKYDVK